MEFTTSTFKRKGTSIQRNTKAIEALRSFVEREGHALVPTGHVENGYQLGHWVTYVRSRKRTVIVDGNGQPVMASLVDPALADLLETFPGWTWGPLAPGPKGDTDRNAKILARHREGRSLGEISTEFGISRQRAHQILRREVTR